MRGRSLSLGFLALTMACVMGAPTTSRAHFVAWTTGSPVYPFDKYPATLCYELVGPIAKDDLWVAWIDNAAALWNKANTGWTFKKCETAEEKKKPNIVFKFNPGDTQISGGARGYGRGGGNVGNWEIQIEPKVTDMSINGTKVGDAGHNGWALENKNGVQTLDAQLVIEHELGHALGLDHNPGACFAPKTGNVEDPICAGTHKGPNGRNPSASDVAEVKKGIDANNKAVDDAKKTAEGAGGTSSKENQMTPSNPDQSGPVWHYCDNPPGYYPQVQNCDTPWRTVVAGPDGQPSWGDEPPSSDPDSGPGSGQGVAPGFGLGGFGFGFGSGGHGDGQSDRGYKTQQQRRP